MFHRNGLYSHFTTVNSGDVSEPRRALPRNGVETPLPTSLCDRSLIHVGLPYSSRAGISALTGELSGVAMETQNDIVLAEANKH